MNGRVLKNKILREINLKEEQVYDDPTIIGMEESLRLKIVEKIEIEIADLQRLASLFPDDDNEVYDPYEISYFFESARQSGLAKEGSIWDPQYWGLKRPEGWSPSTEKHGIKIYDNYNEKPPFGGRDY